MFLIGNVDNLESVIIPLINGSLGSGITAACTDCDSAWSGVVNDPTTWSELGYNTTGATTTAEAPGQFYRVAASVVGGSGNFDSSVLTLSFATPVTAFGAYITGIQTSLGTTAVTFNDGAAQTFPLLNSGTIFNFPAGIQFFGFIDSNPVSSITFTTTNPTNGVRDIWGIDDIWVGQAVPEPATLAMMGGGLLALGLLGRCRKRG